jgi:hypothetical protein
MTGLICRLHVKCRLNIGICFHEVSVRLNFNRDSNLASECLKGLYLLCYPRTKSRRETWEETTLFLFAGVLGAYSVYTPLPDNIEEPWKLTWSTTQMKMAMKWQVQNFINFMNID